METIIYRSPSYVLDRIDRAITALHRIYSGAGPEYPGASLDAAKDLEVLIHDLRDSYPNDYARLKV